MSLYEVVYNTIKDDINNGRIPTYSSLNETQLAERFKVSKITVKTALRKLCDEYYLKAFPRKGYKVNVLTDEEFEQLKELRLHYERFSITQAIIRASDEEIKTLLVTPEGISPTIFFHTQLAGLTKNKYHYEIMEKIMKFQYNPPISSEQIKKNHEKIVDELLKRNLTTALSMLEKDIALIQ